MNAYNKMRAARMNYVRNMGNADDFAAYMSARDAWVAGGRNKPRYGLVAVIACLVTSLAFGGAALAYQATQEPSRLVCSSDMSESEATFRDIYKVDGDEIVIGCKYRRDVHQ